MTNQSPEHSGPDSQGFAANNTIRIQPEFDETSHADTSWNSDPTPLENGPTAVSIIESASSTAVHTAENTTLTAPFETIRGKPVIYRKAKTILNFESEEFHHKLLCDGMVFNMGDACVFGCRYCYVETVIFKLVAGLINEFNSKHGTAFGFQDVVIRRTPSLEVLREQLIDDNGTSRFNDPNDTRVVYSSTLVDPASNLDILRETAEACILIFENTNWQIRLLSKSALLQRLIEKEMIPKQYHHRLILGFSIGTLDDEVAKAIEVGTSPPSKRIKALHWLQDQGIRTFGMICPNLPQADYDAFSKEVCEAIRTDRCEHVWAEVINVRGDTKIATQAALQAAGLHAELSLFNAVFGKMRADGKPGPKNREAWEQYARRTFEAHSKNVPADKLRFLQYVTPTTAVWWADRRKQGAVPLGKPAVSRNLLAGGESAPLEPVTELSEDDLLYREERESIVRQGVGAELEAARAIHEIQAYKNGKLWKQNYLSFEKYLDATYGYKKAHGYRLSRMGRFLSSAETALGGERDGAISPAEVAKKLPITEGQLRPLLESVPEEHQVACWRAMVEKHPPSTLTGAIVAEEAKAYMRKNQITKPSKAKPSKAKTPEEKALVILEKLIVAVADFPNARDLDHYLKGMRWLLSKEHATNSAAGDRGTTLGPTTTDASSIAGEAQTSTAEMFDADRPDDLPPAPLGSAFDNYESAEFGVTGDPPPPTDSTESDITIHPPESARAKKKGGLSTKAIK